MRKTTFIHGLGLALLLGAGVAVSAQPPAGGRQGDRPGERPRAGAADTTQRGRRGPGGPGGPGGPEGRRGPGGRGPEGLLLRGITLSEAQRQQVTALREQQRARREADRPRPDSATIAARRQQLTAQRQRDEAALRAILTPEQRTRFDANRAELEKRIGDRQGQRGPGAGRGPRGAWRGRQG